MNKTAYEIKQNILYFQCVCNWFELLPLFMTRLLNENTETGI